MDVRRSRSLRIDGKFKNILDQATVSYYFRMYNQRLEHQRVKSNNFNNPMLRIPLVPVEKSEDPEVIKYLRTVQIKLNSDTRLLGAQKNTTNAGTLEDDIKDEPEEDYSNDEYDWFLQYKRILGMVESEATNTLGDYRMRNQNKLSGVTVKKEFEIPSGMVKRNANRDVANKQKPGNTIDQAGSSHSDHRSYYCLIVDTVMSEDSEDGTIKEQVSPTNSQISNYPKLTVPANLWNNFETAFRLRNSNLASDEISLIKQEVRPYCVDLETLTEKTVGKNTENLVYAHPWDFAVDAGNNRKLNPAKGIVPPKEKSPEKAEPSNSICSPSDHPGGWSNTSEKITTPAPSRLTFPVIGDNTAKKLIHSKLCTEMLTQLGNVTECDFCNKIFPYRKRLKKHMSLHTAKKPHQCDICQKAFSSNEVLSRHKRGMHGGEKPFECKICKKGFITKGFLNEHSKIHSGERLFRCKVCGKDFALNGTLKRHMTIHSNEKPYHCEDCKEDFRDLRGFKNHIRFHTGASPFQCEICKKAFARTQTLKRHMDSHSVKGLFRCRICEEAFEQAASLGAHVRIHNEEDPSLRCKICDKLYGNKHSLACHVRIHTGEKPFKCNICEKAFRQAVHYKSHMRIHTGEKPFRCNVCDKAFSRASRLKVHERVHTGEKPYKCEHCQRMFRESTNYKTHLWLHSGKRPYRCKVCEKTFAQSGGLRCHMRKHTGEKPYRCELCDKAFTISGNRSKHMTTHHAGEK